jgi:hypothetical protein
MGWKEAVKVVGESVPLPLIQWINLGASLLPPQVKGGFVMPESEAAICGDTLLGSFLVTANFSGGSEKVYYTPTMRVAVLATRFEWRVNGVTVPSYEEGARGKLRALCVVQGTRGPFQAVLTLSGLATRDFLNALREHRQRVWKGTRAAGHPAPASIFFMELVAGQPVRLPQGGTRTPMFLTGDFDPERDYIGDATFSQIDWEEVKAWGAKTPEPELEPEEPEPEPPEPALEPEILEWARNLPCPVGGKTFPKGTPMGELPEAALRYIAENFAEKYPEAAQAASVLLAPRPGEGKGKN